MLLRLKTRSYVCGLYGLAEGRTGTHSIITGACSEAEAAGMPTGGLAGKASDCGMEGEATQFKGCSPFTWWVIAKGCSP
jgi:hypothetical protein